MPIAKINNNEFEFLENSLVSDILINNNFNIPLPCGCKGICKNCKIKITGSTSPLTKTEKEYFTDDEIKNNIRLACTTRATGNIEIFLPEFITNITDTGYTKEYIKDNNIEDDYYIVIDIGTTTIAAHLYKGVNFIKSYSDLNKQQKFGADVISRIDYTIKNEKESLQKTILNQIEEIIACFVKPAFMIITGNTTMLHFLLNLDSKNLAVAPFTPTSYFGEYYNILGIKTYIPRCISAYVGADITCGIVASGMLDESGTSLLVDIGTNGEMAYYDGNILKTTSTAAGPCFEGAGIHMGMPAKSGAINKVFLENDKIKYTTINNIKPIGICGSGLIDLVSIMLKTNALDETGLLNEENEYVVDLNGKLAYKIDDIMVTSDDIRKIQLAKSAIKSGIETLLSNNKVDTLYIAGGFGMYLDINNAQTIGLLPTNFYNEVKIIGNSSISGATVMLFSKNELSNSNVFTKNAQAVELSTSPEFMDYYIENMMF